MNIQNVRLNSANMNSNYKKKKEPSFSASTKDLTRLAEINKELYPWFDSVAKAFVKAERQFRSRGYKPKTFIYPLTETTILPKGLTLIPIGPTSIRPLRGKKVADFDDLNRYMSKPVDAPFKQTLKSQLIEKLKEMGVKNPYEIVLTKES